MLTANHIYKFTTQTQVQGQACLNVFYYECIAASPATEIVMAAANFGAALWASLDNVMATSTVLERVSIVDMSVTDGEFAETVLGLSGTEIGQPLPSFVALGYRLVRTTRATRHGMKRFAGSTEAVVEGNEIAAVFDGVIAAVSGFLAANFTFEDSPYGGTFRPLIVRLSDTSPQTITVSQPVASATFYGVTTQSTRKPSYGGQ